MSLRPRERGDRFEKGDHSVKYMSMLPHLSSLTLHATVYVEAAATRDISNVLRRYNEKGVCTRVDHINIAIQERKYGWLRTGTIAQLRH